MFYEKIPGTTTDAKVVTLAFLKSLDVHVYPSGRRNSDLISNKDGSTRLDDYYIPFDPEARLNTEYNNRRVSGLNGYTQTFLQTWEEGKENSCVRLILGGYSFELYNCSTPNEFGNTLLNHFEMNLNNPELTKIYANIRIEKVPLYSDFGTLEQDYCTWILRNQTNSSDAEPCIDKLITGRTTTKSEDYFFSGLSFSTAPLAASASEAESKYAYSAEKIVIPEGYKEQEVVSLCILSRANVNSSWEVYQPALLPDIRHGKNKDEVEVTKIKAEDAAIDEITFTEGLVTDKLERIGTKDSSKLMGFVTMEVAPITGRTNNNRIKFYTNNKNY